MTAVQLIRQWRARDDRYDLRRWQGIRAPVTREEQAAIAAWRGAEIRHLPPAERARAWAALATWTA